MGELQCAYYYDDFDEPAMKCEVCINENLNLSLSGCRGVGRTREEALGDFRDKFSDLMKMLDIIKIKAFCSDNPDLSVVEFVGKKTDERNREECQS